MKDIFIDSNLAKNFANPVDINYQNLIKWLSNYNQNEVEKNPENKANYAHLVVNQKLLVEYLRSSYSCSTATAMPTIINIFTRQGRLIKLEKKQLEDFMGEYFTKKVERRLLSNIEDHCHICSILSSHRKMALTYDANLANDLNSFPGFKVIISDRPENIGYE